MSNAIVYLSATGNTKMLADAIAEKVGDVVYNGKPDDAAKEADTIYVGFWTQAFSCPAPIADFLKSLDGKKVFLFGTAGYGNTDEFFGNIIDSVKAHVPASCEVVGSYMCMGKVSENKMKAIAEDQEKFNSMKPMLDESQSHPNAADIDALKAAL